MGSAIEEKAKSILTGTEGFSRIAEGIYILPAQGNALAIIGTEGVLILDSGPGGTPTARMIESLRTVTDLPVQYICYSHGHLGYNDGANDWLAHNAQRGEAPPVLVAHANCLHRYRRYRETLGLQKTLANMQFPGLNVRFDMVDPDLTFEQRITVPLAGRKLELLWVPSETDDTIALWMPEEKLLYAGASFPGTTIPNIGTPLRTQRFTIRWAESCELMASLGAQTLVQEFGPVISDPADIHERLTHTATTLRWFRSEVVARMNRGMSEHEILADMRYPDSFNTLEYMKARYGAPEYIVRDLYREENGWWDRNPTSLHPIAPGIAGDAVLSAVDPATVIARAEALRDEGRIQEALHVIDLVALAGMVNEHVLAARALKADLCRRRASEVRPYVSKAMYNSSAAQLEAGRIGWARMGGGE